MATTTIEKIKTKSVPAASDLKQSVQDNSAYIEEIFKAQQAAKEAELLKAYKQNVANIDRAGEGVDEAYRAAGNQTVANNERLKRSFAQRAAATGLNNGAAGQAELARSVALQNNLNDLNTQKAQTVADLDLQRTNAETEYNNAIAQAKAEGDFQRGNALYEEKVRVQNALMSAMQQEYQNEITRYQLEQERQQYIDQLALQHGKNAGVTSWGGTGAVPAQAGIW